jgi:hypothetical protein
MLHICDGKAVIGFAAVHPKAPAFQLRAPGHIRTMTYSKNTGTIDTSKSAAIE